MSGDPVTSGGCPPEEQLLAFIQNALAPPARAELERHLSGCSSCFEAVRVLAGGASPAEAVRAPVLERGAALGRYVVLERVGAGGMGVVYAAFDPELERKVAVKLLHPGAGGHEGAVSRRARLRLEAQALARLTHPAVVSIYDVGLQGDQVFLTMQWVDGLTLRQWLAEAPRGWRELIRLLTAAGEGLAAAHAVGLVHRDFKPDNVMVGRAGGAWVTDFGLARLLASAGEDGNASAPATSGVPGLTQPGARPGSPAYMAPEQHAGEAATALSALAPGAPGLTQPGARPGSPAYMAPEQHDGEAATALSDQYAFCVTLAEALTGTRPEAPGQVPALPRGVPGGVRAVLARGLSRHPASRFPSMRALLDALHRGVDAPSRRRRRSLFAALAAGLLAAGGWAYRAEQRGRAQLCPDAAAHLAGSWDEEARAAIERAFAGTGVAYAGTAAREATRALDDFSRRWGALRQGTCRATRVLGEQSEEVLSLKMACLDRGLRELRALAAVFREADREVVRSAVQAASSLTPPAACEDVEALRAEVRPPADPAVRQAVAEVRDALADVEALGRSGKHEDAAARAEPLLVRARELDHPPLVAEVLLQLGTSRERRYQTKEALLELEEAVWLAHGSRHDPVAARASVEMVITALKSGNWVQAGAWTRYARAALQRLSAAPALEAELENALGAGANLRFESEQAVRHFTRANEIAREGLGPDHPYTLLSHANIFMPMIGAGRVREARAGFEDALRRLEQQLGRSHPSSQFPLHGAIDVHLLLGEVGEARARLEQLRELVRASYPEGTMPWYWLAMFEARVAQAEGRYREAVALYERAEEIRAAGFGGDVFRRTELTCQRAQAELRLGEATRAAGRVKAAMEGAESLAEQGPMLAFDCMRTLAEAWQALGRNTDALGMHERARALLARMLGEDHHLAAIARIGLSSALRALGRAAEAVEQSSRGRTALEAALGPAAPWALRGRREEAEALLAAGHAPGALSAIAPAAERAGSAPDPNDAAQILSTRAKALRELAATPSGRTPAGSRD